MAGAPRDLVEVVSHPLQAERYADAVADGGAGAIVTFAGVTRNTFEGRRVVQLEYEAYVPMVRHMWCAAQHDRTAAQPDARGADTRVECGVAHAGGAGAAQHLSEDAAEV